MFSDSRAYARMPIPIYYTGGSFHLIDGEREYHYIRANDVCEAGIGLDVPSPLERGVTVKVSYTTDGLRTDVHGTVMWCVRADRVGVSMRSYQNYRVGIRLHAATAAANAALLLAFFTVFLLHPLIDFNLFSPLPPRFLHKMLALAPPHSSPSII